MRTLLIIYATVITAQSSRPVDESELDEIILRGYILFASSYTAELPKTIPPSVGIDVGRYLCEWARLTEDRFLALSN